jgi:hypothetical protein
MGREAKGFCLKAYSYSSAVDWIKGGAAALCYRISRYRIFPFFNQRGSDSMCPKAMSAKIISLLKPTINSMFLTVYNSSRIEPILIILVWFCRGENSLSFYINNIQKNFNLNKLF